MKAIILAAGLGSRLKPLTDKTPKALVKAGGKPLLHHAAEKLIAAGVNEIVVNIHHHGDMMRSHIEQLDYPGVRFHISDETHELLDTGGALKKAAPLLQGPTPFFIYNADVLSGIDLKDMLEQHQKTKPLATLAVTPRQSSRYFLWKDGRLAGWINTKTGEQIWCRPETESGHSGPNGCGHSKPVDPSVGGRPAASGNTMSSGNKIPGSFSNTEKLAFSGIHLADPALPGLITETGRFSVKDLYLRLAGDHCIIPYLHDHRFWADTGTPEKLKQAEMMLQHMSQSKQINSPGK